MVLKIKHNKKVLNRKVPVMTKGGRLRSASERCAGMQNNINNYINCVKKETYISFMNIIIINQILFCKQPPYVIWRLRRRPLRFQVAQLKIFLLKFKFIFIYGVLLVNIIKYMKFKFFYSFEVSSYISFTAIRPSLSGI